MRSKKHFLDQFAGRTIEKITVKGDTILIEFEDSGDVSTPKNKILRIEATLLHDYFNGYEFSLLEYKEKKLGRSDS